MKESMNIGLIGQGGSTWMGGVEYVRNLGRAISAVCATDGVSVESSLFIGEKQKPEWPESKDEKPLVIGRRKRPLPILGRFFPQRNQHFVRAIEDAGCRFVYPLTYDNQYNVEVSLPLGAAGAAFQWAGWIPDFQHLHLPQWFSEKELAKRDRGIRSLIQEAPVVVLSSATAAEDLRRFYPEAAPKAEVLTFATFPRADWYSDGYEEDLSWLPERYFMASNQFWKHKNHLVIFEALRILRDRGVKPVIVCTGQLHDFRDPDYPNLILRAVHKLGVASQVMLVGLVPRRMQIEMMRRCLAVVQPSLFEGWSTVVEDSRVLGKPCVLSDLPIHREQNPPGAQFFDPHSPESLATEMAKAWETLSAGPDREAETRARQRAEERILEVGRRFLEIARRACGAPARA